MEERGRRPLPMAACREREREGEVEKGRRDVLLKFATLLVASLRLIKNCAGLCASLFMPVVKEIAHA